MTEARVPATMANPYPGLRAFEPEDSATFFGREAETDELRRRLRSARLLAVVGGSGSGKSSLVRSGLIPSLHAGHMAGAGSHWRVAVMRPGEDPLGRLAAALDDDAVLGPAGARADTRCTMLDALLRDSRQGLVDAVRQAGLPAGDQLLLVVDQFEELFRYRPGGGVDEATRFVGLLLQAAQQHEVPLYVVLTMRSEYIGDCLRFDGLPEAINAGQYLIPRLSRDAMRLAITGPAAMSGAPMAPRLATRLLNEVGHTDDPLPVLQHALMRTWDAWQHDHADGEPIDLRHYEAIGTLRDALSRHADEAWNELADARERDIAQRLFQALTETTADGRGIRRPCTLAHLVAVCQTNPYVLLRIIDRFRAPGRAFLQPPAGTPIGPTTRVDISHESLMRRWGRLVDWVALEAKSTDLYRQLREAAQRHARGRSSLWRRPELTLALRWRQAFRPVPAWAGEGEAAARDFAQAMHFLDRSQLADRLRRGLIAGTLALAAFGAIGWQMREARKQEARVAELQSDLIALQQENESAQQAQQAASAHVQRLRSDNTGLRQQVAALVDERAQRQAAIVQLRSDNQTLEAQLMRLAAEVTWLRQRAEELSVENEALRTKLMQLNRQRDRLMPVPATLRTEADARQRQLDALRERLARLKAQLQETLPCDVRVYSVDDPPAPSVSAVLGALETEVPPLPAVPPDAARARSLQDEINRLAQQLADLLAERARLDDEADWLARENTLLAGQAQALTQENTALRAEQEALQRRQAALKTAVGKTESLRSQAQRDVQVGRSERETLTTLIDDQQRQLEEVQAAVTGQANRLGVLRAGIDATTHEIDDHVGRLREHVERLLAQPGVGPELAALLAVQARRWAPFDPEALDEPAVYNTLWLALRRLDEPAAARLLAPGDPAAGKLATTRTQVLVDALCQRVARPFTEAEWRRHLPADACYRAETANPCRP